MRRGYLGNLAPAKTFGAIGDAGAVVNSYLVGSATDVSTLLVPKTYMITSASPKIVLEDNGAVQAGTSISHGAHSSLVGEDVIVYTGKVGGVVTRSLFYSFNDATDGDVGRVTLNGTPGSIGSLDDDFMSVEPSGNAVLTKGVPHKMCEGSDLVMYITNGNWIASYDGNDADADGKFNVNALNCGNGWVAVDVRAYKNFIAIACVNNTGETQYTHSSRSKILLWDGFSPEPNFVYEIADSRLSALFVADSILYAFTDGKGNTTKLWSFDGARFKVVDEHLSSYIGKAPNRNCIDYYDDTLIWASGNSAAIIQYGKLSSSSRGFHITMSNTDGTNSSATTGFLKNVEQNSVRVSGLYNATYRLIDSANGGYSVNPSLVTRLFRLPHRSIIKKVTVYFAQLGTGASVTLSLFKNKNTLSIGGSTDLLNKQLTATALGTGTESFSFETFIDDVDSFYMNIKFDHAAVTNTAAIIRDIEFEIEPTNAY